MTITTLPTTVDAVVSTVGIWLLVAGLTEAITEIFKQVLPSYIKEKATYGLSIIIGIGLAFAFQLNPFGLNGTAEFVSTMAAGVLASRGANYLNSLLKKLGMQASAENK